MGQVLNSSNAKIKFIDSLDARMKYVEQLTHKNKPIEELFDKDFLKPKPEIVAKSTIIEDKNNVQRISTVEIRSDSLSIEEAVKLSREVELNQEKNETPDWAKLSMASSSPNSKRQKVVDYY